MSLTHLDGKIWLSDTGIEQALKLDLINNLETRDIQPVTTDVRSDSLYQIGPFQRKLIRHTPLEIDSSLETFGDLKSSVRRNLLQAVYSRKDSGFIITNTTAQPYILNANDTFGQIYIGGSMESVVQDLEHGNVILEDKEIKNFFKEGLISYRNNSPVIQNGFLILHAADKLFPLNVNPLFPKNLKNKEKPNIAESMLLSPEGKLFSWSNNETISLREYVELSPYTALQLFYFSKDFREMQLGGVVDPGYKGGLGYQPMFNSSTLIKPGDPIIHARVIYYKNSIRRPYNHIERKPSFQNAEWSS